MTITGLQISPAPTDEEAAAITASIELLWPRPVAVVIDEAPRSMTWRFSGRWWRTGRYTGASRPWG